MKIQEENIGKCVITNVAVNFWADFGLVLMTIDKMPLKVGLGWKRILARVAAHHSFTACTFSM